MLALMLGGCATTPPLERAAIDRSAIELTEVPFHPQQRYQCGPAALATVLGWSGAAVTPEQLVARLYVPERQGSLPPEVQAQARQHGRLGYQLAGSLDALLDELAAGHPVMVLQNLGLSWWPRWHYAVVVGHDPVRREFVLRSGTQRRQLMSEAAFARSWALARHWALVVLPPGRVPASADPAGYLRAAFALEGAAGDEAAARAYWAGLERWPADPGLSLALSHVLHRAGHLAGADRALRSAIRGGAESGMLLNNLAWLLVEQRRWDEAEAAAASAITYGGQFLAEYRDTLAQIRCQRAGGGCSQVLAEGASAPRP